MQIGMLLFDRLTQLDLTGPYEVLARIPNATMHLVAKSRAAVRSDTNLVLTPSTTFADGPPLDLVFVPGGGGQIAATDDDATLDWLRTTGERARWVASACTGTLLLAAAGLLAGYRAATHWAFMDLLPLAGAIPVHERVVVDRNRFTGGGVTAGIDIALTIVGELCGRAVAEEIQLELEYAPAPPFDAGHPDRASPDQVARARAAVQDRWDVRAAQLRRLRATRSG